MESEKVKEIKRMLYNIDLLTEEYRNAICKQAVELINELESENEKLSKKFDMWEKIICKKNDCIAELRKENGELLKENDELEKQCVKWSELDFKKRNKIKELKDRIAELEEYIKGNEQDAKAFVNGWHKDLETELKQFAERLKESAGQHYVGQNGVRISDITYSISDGTINKILKEFIND